MKRVLCLVTTVMLLFAIRGGSSYDHVWDGSIYNLKAS